MAKHALLSASSSHRWLSCPPSARLSESYEGKGSDYALEGTETHELCEYRLKTTLGIKAKDPSESLSFYSDEMSECADGYVAFILELLEAAKQGCADPVALIEQRLDFSRYVEGGFGTGDAVIIADGTLHVIDYKHGMGVLVEAEGNSQMMLYGIGALELFDPLYDIDEVNMTIYQPRRNNISTYTLSKDQLYQWADGVLKPAAELAFAGDGEYASGDWCMFCKAKSECRKRAEENMELARYDFKRPPLLEDDEVEAILTKIDGLISWANDIKTYALESALGGKVWQGFKLVEGRSNRRYIHEDAVADVVTDAGFDPYERKLQGITAMEKMLGKAKFQELLGNLVDKPQGKPTLVPSSDKRPAINTAADDFADTQEN